MSRSKKAALNLASQLILQVVVAICGFIVPKFMLESFGSELNGIVASISQFLGIITLMETSFGAVAKTAFYKPLASGSAEELSGVYNATESFFRKIALAFSVYCILLSFLFPYIKSSDFGYWFTVALVIIVGLSSFMQYYFGMSYTLALNADQLGYVSAFMQIIVIILNACLTVILINLGASIHIVKLVSAGIFILKPLAINMYGKYRYRINKRIPKDFDSISQKWNNFGQGVAMYVHTKVPYIFITLFLTFKEVSVYSVYSLITTSLAAIITSISTGFVSGLGNMYAKKETERFKKMFSLYEFVNTIAAFLVYTIAINTMMSFIGIYTANLTDANYNRPLFGIILVLGELIYCLRLPYLYAITNAGHFKQIKNGAYVEAGLNVVLSCILLPFLGIVGLAISTVVAMTYRTGQIIVYCSKNIILRSSLHSLKRIVINVISALGVIGIVNIFPYKPENFGAWILFASVVGSVALCIFCSVNLLFYREDYKSLFEKIKSVLKRK